MFVSIETITMIATGATMLIALMGGFGFMITRMDRFAAELRAEMGGLRAEIGGLRTEMGGLRTEIAEVRTSVAQVRDGLTEVKVAVARIEALRPQIIPAR